MTATISREVKPMTKKQKIILIGGVVGVTLGICLIITICVVTSRKDPEDPNVDPTVLVEEALTAQPIIDGTNKFPWTLRRLVDNDLTKVNFSAQLSQISPWKEISQTDLPHLREGRVGAVFWSARVDCNSQHKDAVMQTLEQVDVIQRLVHQYPNDLVLARTAEDIESGIQSGAIASVIALGGGHSVQSSLGTLRLFYEMGARVMQLSDYCATPWSSAPGASIPAGLTEFGSVMIEEMNRLGMIIDLTGSSNETAKSAMIHSSAPVIFSSSGAQALCFNEQNIGDELLNILRDRNKGIIMVGPEVHTGSCKSGTPTIADIAEHIDYIRNITGVDHVGIGGNFDSRDMSDVELNSPALYPDLLLELAETGRWSSEDLQKLAGGNLLRVFKAVEQVRGALAIQGPIQKTISLLDLTKHNVSLECTTATYNTNTSSAWDSYQVNL